MDLRGAGREEKADEMRVLPRPLWMSKLQLLLVSSLKTLISCLAKGYTVCIGADLVFARSRYIDAV